METIHEVGLSSAGTPMSPFLQVGESLRVPASAVRNLVEPGDVLILCRVERDGNVPYRERWETWDGRIEPYQRTLAVAETFQVKSCPAVLDRVDRPEGWWDDGERVVDQPGDLVLARIEATERASEVRAFKGVYPAGEGRY